MASDTKKADAAGEAQDTVSTDKELQSMRWVRERRT